MFCVLFTYYTICIIYNQLFKCFIQIYSDALITRPILISRDVLTYINIAICIICNLYFQTCIIEMLYTIFCQYLIFFQDASFLSYVLCPIQVLYHMYYL